MKTSEDPHLQEVLNKLHLRALEDGQVTEDEKAVMDQIKKDFVSFRNLLAEAEEDGIITEEEEEQIRQYKKKVLQNAYDVSISDFVITADERTLISTLIKLFYHKRKVRG